MEGWSSEQIVVFTLAVVLSLGLLVAILRTNASITLRRFAGVVVLALAFATIVWTLGGAIVEVSRAVTFVATCTSMPANVGASIRRLQTDSAARVLLLDLGRGACDEAEVAAAASLPKTSVTVAFVGGSAGPATGPASPVGLALRKAVREAASAISLSTIVVLYDATESWWDREFVTALRDPTTTGELTADVYFADIRDGDKAYALQFTFIGTLQPGYFNAISNPVQLRLTGGRNISAQTLGVDLCFALDAPIDWSMCASSDGGIVLENVSLRQIAPTVAAWEWQGSGISPFQDLIFERTGPSGGIQRCLPGCDKGLAAKRLEPGWHTLRVLGRVRTATSTIAVAPVHLVVLVGSTGATVIVGATETLAARGWPARMPPNGFARPLLEAAMANTTGTSGNPGLSRLNSFPRPPRIHAGLASPGDCIIRTDAPADVLDACLKAARAVMIVEPEPLFLRTFGEKADGLLQRGIPITVAGLPEISPTDAVIAEKWLPGWPAIGTGVVETRQQLLLLADCSGLAQMATEDTTGAMANVRSRRAFADQYEIINALKIGMRAVPHVAAVALGSAEAEVVRFEHQTAWRPSITVGFVPGCLRDTTDDILDQRELVATAVLEQRIDAFNPSGPETVLAPHPTFRLDGTRYPGSAIVLFSTEAAQYAPYVGALKRSGAAVMSGGLTTDWSAVPPPSSILDDLERADVKVVIVQLPTNPRFKAVAEAARKPAEKTWEEALDKWKTHGNVVIIRHDANAAPAATAAAILHEIARPIASVRLEQFGRSMDPRVPADVPAVPEAFRPLKLASAGRRLQSLGPEYDSALLAAERNDRGAPVVALAYSPFDPVSWASDIASNSALSDDFASICNAPCTLEGWLAAFRARTNTFDVQGRSSALGIQRYLDLAAQSSVVVSRPSLLRLDALELSADSDRLTARFRLPIVGAAWADPTVEVPDAPTHCAARASPAGCPMILAAVDPGGGTATYAFSTTAGLPARIEGYKIRTDWLASESDAVVPFWLTPRQELSPNAGPFLNAMRASGALHATPPLPRAQLSALPIAAITLAVLTTTLFTPLVRPWTALVRLLQRRRRTESTAVFDVDFVSELAGTRPARYEASRRAGDPAFMRRMQAGDSLARAVIGDLALMTPIGRRVGAVARLPRVHLREIGESFDLVIAIDDAPGLLLPGDVFNQSRKRFAARAVVNVICGTVTRTRGRFSIVALRGSTSFREIDQFDSEMIDTIFDELFREGGSRDPIRSPAELPPTAVRVIISDFLSGTVAQYAAWTQGVRSAAIHIIDPQQGAEVGVTRDARTGRIYDRSVWEAGDAEALVHRRAADMRYALEQSGATYAAINVEMSNLEVAAMLSESGMLDLTRRQ